MLLENGRISSVGDVGQITNEYVSINVTNASSVVNKSGPATLSLSTLNGNGKQTDIIASGEKVVFVLQLHVAHSVDSAAIGLGITSMTGERIVTFHTQYQYTETLRITERCTCSIEWDENFLAPDNYLFVAALYESNQLIASWENIGGITVVASDYFGTGRLPNTGHQGHILARSRWRFDTDS
ncbi:Wzt carbohydrate-binding domain-containing protein [Chloroflexota bacterium]